MERLEYVNRKGTDCAKWDNMTPVFGTNDLLPMWVADMDFKAPKAVRDALSQYAEEGLFGYYKIPESYYDAFIKWEKEVHQLEVSKDWIRFSPGVVSAFNWIINFMTNAGDSVIIQTPVYYPFINAIKDNDRKIITSPLINSNGVYTINFEDFEKKVIDNNVKLFILSSPHNPVGRVWDKNELDTLLSICKKHNVYVISDEIHQDLTYKHQLPSLCLGGYDDILFTLTAPSKTFNLAGLQNSIIIISDKELRDKWDNYALKLRLANGNAFGYIAAEAAYTHGSKWLNAVKEVIYENYLTLKNGLTDKYPDIEISPLEGTYLMWINMAAYVKPDEIKAFVQEKCGLAVDYGNWFGGDENKTFIRINLATHNDNIAVALNRMLYALS